jgi:hypothetical protein
MAIISYFIDPDWRPVMMPGTADALKRVIETSASMALKSGAKGI